MARRFFRGIIRSVDDVPSSLLQEEMMAAMQWGVSSSGGVAVSDSETFLELLGRVRAGDQIAAADLVRQFEPELRRAVRVRLSDPRLRRVIDSVDVCQSVLANFFVRVSVGEFDLRQPEQLLHLLLVMARNKLRDKARRQQAVRRDQRRLEAQPNDHLDNVAGREPGPEHVAEWRDLLAEVRRLLNDDERFLADQRAEGREWGEIAAQLGVQPDGLRKKLSRALDRVVARLGLEVIEHE
jgi:RNA polymerase sigma factor (sigma-70 family)